MDFYREVSVSGEYPQEQVPSTVCSKLGGLSAGSLDDLFSTQNTEVDVSLEWLSIFVEDCLSSTGNCLPAPKNVASDSATPKPSKPLQSMQKPQQKPSSPLQNLVIPGKARSKRKRATTITTSFSNWVHHLNPENQNLHITSSDPPLLQQAYWLADSELIVPKKEESSSNNNNNNNSMVKEEEEGSNGQPRRCTHCLAQRTPQWRAGPLGPKTLCNACGVRYKSGRLLPEYRPAKSPTFVSYKHSNSHKKVMEMRMAVLSSIPSDQ
ncbi:unnamed protein product, partial [Vitis vinifera]